MPRAIQWKNRARIAEVERDAGVTVEWKAADGNDAVLILAANADRYSGDSAMCLCLAPARDGRFTVPPIALGNLPPTLEDDDLAASYLLLTEIPVRPPARIQARGLDAAFAAFVSASARPVMSGSADRHRECGAGRGIPRRRRQRGGPRSGKGGPP